jgi:2-methylaconitate cis-trans-isomerase PrpF
MMRSGTSKGLFLHRKDLPPNQEEWANVLLSVMGSRYGDKKQIDGIGGATSTTSKVAVVSKSEREDADVDYTFAQVAVGQEKVDFSGNCGNMAPGVGPFALDEGLVRVLPGQTEVSELLSHIFIDITLITSRLTSGYTTLIQVSFS